MSPRENKPAIEPEQKQKPQEAFSERAQERVEAEKLAGKINDIAGAQAKALEQMPSLAEKPMARKAKRWGRTTVVLLGLTLFKALGGGVAPAEAGQRRDSRGRAEVRQVVRHGERIVFRALRQQELNDIRKMRDAHEALERLMDMHEDMLHEHRKLDHKYQALMSKKARSQVQLLGIPNALEYVQTVDAYVDATIELQQLEQMFTLVGVNPQSPGYAERVARFKELVRRTDALAEELKGMQGSLGWDLGNPPRPVARYLEMNDEMEDILPEMRGVEHALADTEVQIDQRQDELGKTEEEVRSRSRKREVIGIATEIGGAILKDKLRPWRR